jgi:aldose 1-epimerase
MKEIVNEQQRGRVRDVEVDVITLSDGTCTAVLTNVGAQLIELHVPDRNGNLADVVLQRPSLDDMATDENYMGSTAGRYANRTPTPIGKNIAEVHHSGAGRTTGSGVGYDHNWVLDGVGTREVLVVADPGSGRRLAMSTNQPGVQLYVGGYLDGVSGKDPVGHYEAFAGFTLETQTFPDAVNHAHFPRAELRPGDTYRNTMAFAFLAG